MDPLLPVVSYFSLSDSLFPQQKFLFSLTTNVLKRDLYCHDLDDSILADFCSLLHVRFCKRGDIILQQGALDTGSVFVILKGSVDVYSETLEVVLEVLPPKTLFGLTDSLSNRPRSSTFIASSNCLLAYLPGTAFKAFLVQTPGLRRMLHTKISKLNPRKINSHSFIDASSFYPVDVVMDEKGRSPEAWHKEDPKSPLTEADPIKQK